MEIKTKRDNKNPFSQSNFPTHEIKPKIVLRLQTNLSAFFLAFHRIQGVGNSGSQDVSGELHWAPCLGRDFTGYAFSKVL